jgi:anti-sigma factor RsiW
MHQSMAAAELKESAPAHLRARIEAALPASSPRAPAPTAAPGFNSRRLSRRFFAGGFALGTALSGAIAATLVLGVLRDDQEQRITGEVVSAHLRSLQPDHLTDVETSDQHTVKPWFNGLKRSWTNSMSCWRRPRPPSRTPPCLLRCCHC